MARYLLCIAAAAVLLAAFDHMMKVDEARLCSNDATAYEGCP